MATAEVPYVALVPASEREAWLEARRTGVGASEVPALLGLSPWAGPIAVYAAKLGVEVVEETEAMRWGTRLEPVVMAAFAEETGRNCGAMGTLLRSAIEPLALATPDAFQTRADREDPGVLQIKCSTRNSDWEDGAPDHVVAQVQMEMFVTGCRWGTAVALLSGSKLVFEDMDFNEDFIYGVVLPKIQAFWECVQARVAPIGKQWTEPDAESARKALRALYPQEIKGSFVPLPGHFIELDEERAMLHEQVVKLEKRIETIDNEFIGAIGANEGAVLPNGVSYRYATVSRQAYTVEATSYRSLRRKGKR